jgi:hypothetical protein
MTKIQKVLEEIQDMQDFYKRTKSLRTRIKENDLERSKVKGVSITKAKQKRRLDKSS